MVKESKVSKLNVLHMNFYQNGLWIHIWDKDNHECYWGLTPAECIEDFTNKYETNGKIRNRKTCPF